MALKMLSNGQYQVRSLKEAQEALLGMRNLEAEIKELMDEHGITEMMQDATEMKKAATAYAVENNLDQIQCKGFHATLIQQSYGTQFLATDEDVREAQVDTDRPLKSLRSILRKKFGPLTKGSRSLEIWKRVTKPVIDKAALDDVVSEGLLNVKEITPAFVEKKKAPYLRVFED
jgi:hypothetical protein